MIAGNDLGRRVVTVRGPVRPDELGVVLSHDHILVDAYEVFGAVDYRWIIDDVELAIDEVGRFGGVGGGLSGFWSSSRQPVEPSATRQTSASAATRFRCAGSVRRRPFTS